MVLCEYCGQHFIKRYKLTQNKQPIPLVNIPKQFLQTIPYTELDLIQNNAKLGIQVCQDCKNLCQRDIGECQMVNATGQHIDPKFVKNFISQGKLNVRQLEDKKVIEDIDQEKIRRYNIAKILRR